MWLTGWFRPTASLKILTHTLLERAGRENTSVHGALCAAVLMASRKMRPEWDGTSSVGYTTGYVSFFRDIFLSTMICSKCWMHSNRHLTIILWLPTCSVSDNTTDLGPLKLKALYGPMMRSGKGMEQTIGALTTNGSLCLTNTSDTPIPVLLPENIAGFIKAQNELDSTAFANYFTAHATVSDEGSSYSGTDEIKAWIQEATEKYNMQLSPLVLIKLAQKQNLP